MDTSVQQEDAPPKAQDEFVPPVVGRKRTIALLVVLIGFLIDLLDITIVNVALPSMQLSLGATGSHVQWIVAAYTLAFAVSLITFGRLGDIVGRKKMFLIGVAGFTLASAAAGFAQNPEQLIIMRFVQGAMGAAMVPQVFSIIQVMYAPHERGKAFATLSGVLALGTVGGPLIGALLTTADVAGLGWRSVFLVNVPLGIFALIAGAKAIPESKSDHADKLDIPGVVLITAALFLLIYPVVQGREAGWPAWTFISMAGFVVAMFIFIVYQRRRTESPLVAMSLFKHRSFVGGLIVSFFFMGGVMAFFLFITLYLQVGQGFSVLFSGLAGLPFDIAVPLFGALSARLIGPKLGRLCIQLGLALLIVSMLVFIWLIGSVDDVNMLQLAGPMFLGGMGMGLTFAPLMGYALNDVPGNDAGSASGVLNAVYQSGVALGLAACGTLFFALLSTNAGPSVDGLAPQVRADLAAVGVSGQEADRFIAGFRTCFADQMKLADPSVQPASCLAAQAETSVKPEVAQVISAKASDALRADYQRATSLTLWAQIGLFLIAIFASFLLPRRQ